MHVNDRSTSEKGFLGGSRRTEVAISLVPATRLLLQNHEGGLAVCAGSLALKWQKSRWHSNFSLWIFPCQPDE